MKNFILLFAALLSMEMVVAQKIDYKNNIITVDGKDVAKVNRIKEPGTFGMVSSYELYSLSGKKLVIATLATDFKPDANDNSVYYYRFTFLTADQVGIFTLSKLGAEKSFVKLIGAANIVVNDDLDPSLVKELIASKGKNPTVAVDYTTVSRNRGFGVNLNDDKTIEQEGKIIGNFKDVTSGEGKDSYTISLPDGVLVARISFTGGNNAQNFEVYTPKDQSNRIVPLPTKDKVFAASASADRNQIALGRIVNWLVTKFYL